MHSSGDPWIDRDSSRTLVEDLYTRLTSLLALDSDGKQTDGGPTTVPEPPNRARILPRGSHSVIHLPVFNPEDENSALVTYFQVTYI